MPDTLLAAAILVAIALVLAASMVARLTRIVTVYEYEQALRLRDGRFVDVIGPGRYRLLGQRTTILRLDTRPMFATIPNQEVLTGDGVSVKVTAAIQYRVVDVRRAFLDNASFREALYLAAQIAVRDAVATRTMDEVVRQRDPIGAETLARMQAEAPSFGVEVTNVALKDVMLPGDLKRIFAQVLEAQKAGQAALERARGETAALRSLANAARLADASPSLLTLRAIQAIEGSGGNTLVLGVPGDGGGLVTTPRRGGGEPPADDRRGGGTPGT